jgi:hypothetical protein
MPSGADDAGGPHLPGRTRHVRIDARSSSLQFTGRNEDTRNIGRSLGVDNQLEGSIRKSGRTLRITTQLVRAADGCYLWSRTYRRELRDVFQLQDDIADQVTRALKTTLGPGAAAAERGAGGGADKAGRNAQSDAGLALAAGEFSPARGRWL